MDECFVCGITGDKSRLFDAISADGIQKICERCSQEEDIPVIRRPTSFQLKESERRHTVYERLSGSKPLTLEVSNAAPKSEMTLREIVDRKYKAKERVESKPRPDLVDNFHWKIMRARRNRKISQEQLASEIHESVSTIKMAEQGILPDDDYRIVNKLENVLGIKIVREEFLEDVNKVRKQPARILNFKENSMRDLTISDLQEMKKQKLGIGFESHSGQKEKKEMDEAFGMGDFGEKLYVDIEDPNIEEDDFSEEEKKDSWWNRQRDD